MRYSVTALLLVLSLSLKGQDVSKVNKNLKLPNTLTHEKELRIYKGFGITNYTSLLRLYQNQNGIWVAEFHEHYARVKNRAKLRIEMHLLNSDQDLEYVWTNFLRSYVLKLPNEDQISWKMGRRGTIEKRRGRYTYSTEELLILDGTGYSIMVRDEEKENAFYYSNPKSYLKKFPEVDELVFMNEILAIARSTFGIWTEN